MIENDILAIAVLLIGLIVVIVLGLPLGFSLFCISSTVAFLFTNISIERYVRTFYSGIGGVVLTAIPFFLLAGNIMNEGKITEKLLNLSNALVGHFRGGLAQVNVLVSLLFGGISGSAVADTSGVGTILIPAMIKKGYTAPFSVALTATSSVLGQIIPPSLIMIIYAAAADTSVKKMFLAGIIPGIMIAGSMMLVSYFYALKYHFPRERKTTLREKLGAFRKAVLTLFMPLIMIGGVVSGIFTATESAVVAVLYSIVLTLFVYRSVTVRQLFHIILKTAKASANTLFCIGSASFLGYMIAYFKVDFYVKDAFLFVSKDPWVYILMVVLLFTLLGTFMDAAPAIYIFVPIVAPIGLELGLDPVHIGTMICLVLGLGLVTPPYGLCLLLASSIGKISTQKVFKDLGIVLSAILLTVLIIIFLPDLILFLPRMFD